MIERYSLPKMSAIWNDQNKFRIMLDIELLVCEAQSKLKAIPASALKRIKAKADFRVERIREIEERTQHDIVAFVANVSEYIGSDAKYLHMGLTSSDLLDTTLDVQLVQADGRVVWEAKELSDNYAYPVTDDKFENEQRERRTAAMAATRIAERIFNRFTDDF